MLRLSLYDILSVAFLGISLFVFGPLCLYQSWSYVELPSKLNIKGCKTIFSQHIGLDWIKQCNCDPSSHQFLCNHLNIKALEPSSYFIHLSGSLIKFVFSFAMLSTFGTIVFIIRKGQKSMKAKNYKSYIMFLSIYGTLLYLLSLFLWSSFVHSPLNAHFFQPDLYKTASGWTLCLVSLIFSVLSVFLQSAKRADKPQILSAMYDEGDEGEYEYEDDDEEYSSESR